MIKFLTIHFHPLQILAIFDQQNIFLVFVNIPRDTDIGDGVVWCESLRQRSQTVGRNTVGANGMLESRIAKIFRSNND
jgi:hypothetical protein